MRRARRGRARGAGRQRRLDRGLERPGHDRRRRTSARPSSRPPAACPASPSRTPTRRLEVGDRLDTSSTATLDRRGPARGARRASRARDSGARRAYVRLSTPVAKLVQRLRGNGRVRPLRRAMGRAMTDACRAETSRARRPPLATTESDAPTSSRSRGGSASRGRSSRSSCRSRCSCCSRRACRASSSTSSRARSSARTRCCCSRRSGSSMLGFPLRGYRWALLVRRSGFNLERPRRDRDHLPVVARELPRAGEARRRLPGLPAEDQQHGLAVANVRDRLHRADPRPLRDRRRSDLRPASCRSEAGCRPTCRSSSRSASSSWSCSPVAC